MFSCSLILLDILDSVAKINDDDKTMLRNVLNDPDVNYTVDDVTFDIHGDEPIVIIDTIIEDCGFTKTQITVS